MIHAIHFTSTTRQGSWLHLPFPNLHESTLWAGSSPGTYGGPGPGPGTWWGTQITDSGVRLGLAGLTRGQLGANDFAEPRSPPINGDVGTHPTELCENQSAEFHARHRAVNKHYPGPSPHHSPLPPTPGSGPWPVPVALPVFPIFPIPHSMTVGVLLSKHLHRHLPCAPRYSEQRTGRRQFCTS